MSTTLPPVPSVAEIHTRLSVIFPDGTERRNWLTGDLGARVIFVMLYVGAVDGTGWLRPNQVCRMTDADSLQTDEESRRSWTLRSLGKTPPPPDRWYADTTRESIRDDVLRNSFLPIGAVVERPGLGKTASTPRWSLAADFAALFTASDLDFATQLERWQEAHMTRGARARIAAVHAGLAASKVDEVLVRLPNGGQRVLSPGMSSVIAKAVVEEFAPRFLSEPGVVWLSESSRREEAADLQLAAAVGLPISANEVLPDIVLVDVSGAEARFVFVEVVASDGPITEQRKTALSAVLVKGGHDPARAAFVTAFTDRAAAPYRRLIAQLAWNSFVWFHAEPDKLIMLRDMEHDARNLFELGD